MKKILLEISRQIIETWMTSRIGEYFITLTNLQNQFDLTKNIKEAEQILSKRPYSERLDLREQMERHLETHLRQEDYEKAVLFRNMLRHYDTHILELENLKFI